MGYKPNMYQIGDLNHARHIFLESLKPLGLGSRRKPLYEEKDDLYAVAPGDWDKTLFAVTGDASVIEWKRLFRALSWIKTNEGKFTIQRRFHKSRPIPVIGVDKAIYHLLTEMELPERSLTE